MAQSRVAWELQQTQKAVGNKESDLKGYMQDVRTLSLQLNEAQVEASHAFACLEQQCTIVATQKANMTHAALQRRRVFKSRADAALVQVTLARCKHREHNAQAAKQVQTVKLQQHQHVMTMLRSLIYLTPAANPNSSKSLLIYANLSTLSHQIPPFSPNLQNKNRSAKRLEVLPFYTHSAMVLIGQRADRPPAPAGADRYDFESTEMLLDIENDTDVCTRFLGTQVAYFTCKVQKCKY